MEKSATTPRSRQPLPVKKACGDILHLAWPCLTELILVQIASMVDMMMVGQLGTRAINAVGLAGNPVMMLSMVFAALNVGTTAMISRYRGRGDIYNANRALKHALVIALASGVVMTGLGLLLARPLIVLMGETDPATIAEAALYLRWRMAGMLAVSLSSAVTAALRGMGDSRTAMFYNLAANLINILFNYLLIYGSWGFPRMEVGGAALATSISQIAALVLSLAVVFRGKSDLKLKIGERFDPGREIFGNIIRIGMPSMLEQVVFRVGIIVFTRVVVSLGPASYAAHQLCWNLLSMITFVGQSMTMTTAPLTGQALGRGRPDIARQYNRYAFRMLFTAMALLGVGCFFFGRYFLMLYSPEPDVMETAIPLLQLIGSYIPIMALQFTYSGALQGAGDTLPGALIMMFTVMIMRPILAFGARDLLHLGLVGVNCAAAADQILRSVLIFLRYRSGKWEKIKVK